MGKEVIDKETFIPIAAIEARKSSWDPFDKAQREMHVRSFIFDRKGTVDAYKDWSGRLIEYIFQERLDPERFSKLVGEKVRERGETEPSFSGLLKGFEDAQRETFSGRGEELLSGALEAVRAETKTEEEIEKGHDLLNHLLKAIEGLPTREEYIEFDLPKKI